MNARVQSVFAVVMVACILVIVYSPFVDLPLTDTRADHGPLQYVQALSISTMVAPGMVQLGLAFTGHEAATFANDVVAITCAYLC